MEDRPPPPIAAKQSDIATEAQKQLERLAVAWLAAADHVGVSLPLSCDDTWTISQWMMCVQTRIQQWTLELSVVLNLHLFPRPASTCAPRWSMLRTATGVRSSSRLLEPDSRLSAVERSWTEDGCDSGMIRNLALQKCFWRRRLVLEPDSASNQFASTEEKNEVLSFSFPARIRSFYSFLFFKKKIYLSSKPWLARLFWSTPWSCCFLAAVCSW